MPHSFLAGASPPGQAARGSASAALPRPPPFPRGATAARRHGPCVRASGTDHKVADSKVPSKAPRGGGRKGGPSPGAPPPGKEKPSGRVVILEAVESVVDAATDIGRHIGRLAKRPGTLPTDNMEKGGEKAKLQAAWGAGTRVLKRRKQNKGVFKGGIPWQNQMALRAAPRFVCFWGEGWG